MRSSRNCSPVSVPSVATVAGQQWRTQDVYSLGKYGKSGIFRNFHFLCTWRNQGILMKLYWNSRNCLKIFFLIVFWYCKQSRQPTVKIMNYIYIFTFIYSMKQIFSIYSLYFSVLKKWKYIMQVLKILWRKMFILRYSVYLQI